MNKIDNYLGIAIIGAFARMLDVPLMVIRTNLMISGKAKEAGLIAGVEQFVYVSLVFMSMQKALDTGGTEWLISVLILSAGYGLSVFLGGKINARLYPVKKKYHFIVEPNEWKFADRLRDEGFIVTTSVSYGRGGAKKESTMLVINAKEAEKLMSIVRTYNQPVNYTIEPVVDIRKIFEVVS